MQGTVYHNQYEIYIMDGQTESEILQYKKLKNTNKYDPCISMSFNPNLDIVIWQIQNTKITILDINVIVQRRCVWDFSNPRAGISTAIYLGFDGNREHICHGLGLGGLMSITEEWRYIDHLHFSFLVLIVAGY